MSRALKGSIFLALGLATILMAFALITVYRRAHRDFMFNHTINTLSGGGTGDPTATVGTDWDSHFPSQSQQPPQSQPPLDSGMPVEGAAGSSSTNHSGVELNIMRNAGRPNTSKYDRLPLVPNIDEE